MKNKIFFYINLIFFIQNNHCFFTNKKPLTYSLASIIVFYGIHKLTPLYHTIRPGFKKIQGKYIEYYKFQEKFNPTKDIAASAYLYAHGYSGSAFAAGAITIAQNNPTKVCYSTHFEDAQKRKMFQTNMGQEGDIIQFLYLILELYERYSSLNLIGHSRGTIIILNSLYILQIPNHPILNKMQISEKTRKIILQKIERGSIILKNPVYSIPVVFNCHFGIILGTILNQCFAALTFYRYKPWSYQGLSSIKEKNNLQIPFLIFCGTKDLILDEKSNKDFIKKIKKIFPLSFITTHYYNAGHNDHPNSYIITLKAFLEFKKKWANIFLPININE